MDTHRKFVTEEMDMITRRSFSAGALALTMMPLIAKAQQAGTIPRIGVLWHDASAEAEGPYFTGLIEGFKNLGYVDGRNIKFEHRFPNEKPELFASMAAELVALKVDALVCVGASVSQHVMDATASVPVIFMYVSDPVGSKLVASLGRPGGNATGLTNTAVELTGKRLQFLKELVPGLTRTAVLVNPSAKVSGLYVGEAKEVAAKLGLTLQIFEARSPGELEGAFNAMSKARMQALSITMDGLFFQQRVAIATLALARRLPTCVWSKESLEAGALISYGPDQIAIARRVAVFADKIIKGTKPADIPMEQPTKFDLGINMKTAKALGVKFSQSILVQATTVIE